MFLHYSEIVGVLLFTAPLTAMVTLIASESAGAVPSAYLFAGGFLTVVWTLTLFSVGFSLMAEFWQGTLDHAMASRTPLLVLMAGKVLAVTTATIPSAVIASTLVFLVSGDFDLANPGFTVASGLFAMLGIIAVTSTFSPVLMLARGRPGFFNAILPLGLVLSGFLYPVSLLSAEVEILARFTPMPWAMDGVMRSVEHGEVSWRYSVDWGIASVIAIAYFTLTCLMFNLVERRIKLTGSLGIS